jgi:hypothetical protein
MVIHTKIIARSKIELASITSAPTRIGNEMVTDLGRTDSTSIDGRSTSKDTDPQNPSDNIIINNNCSFVHRSDTDITMIGNILPVMDNGQPFHSQTPPRAWGKQQQPGHHQNPFHSPHQSPNPTPHFQPQQKQHSRISENGDDNLDQIDDDGSQSGKDLPTPNSIPLSSMHYPTPSPQLDLDDDDGFDYTNNNNFDYRNDDIDDTLPSHHADLSGFYNQNNHEEHIVGSEIDNVQDDGDDDEKDDNPAHNQDPSFPQQMSLRESTDHMSATTPTTTTTTTMLTTMATTMAEADECLDLFPSPSEPRSGDDDSIDFDKIDAKVANDRDYFDDVIDIEHTYSQIGFAKGKVDALKRTKAQGIALGFEYGHEMGEEIGFYFGFCFGLLESFRQECEPNLAPQPSNPSSTLTTTPSPQPRDYNLDLSDPTLTLDEIKDYNRVFYSNLLIEEEGDHNDDRVNKSTASAGSIDDQDIIVKGLTRDTKSESQQPLTRTTTASSTSTIKKDKITQLQHKLAFSPLKYTSTITQLISLLSLAQSIRFMPGETGDVHLVADLRSKSKALFARLGVAAVFKDDGLIDF